MRVGNFEIDVSRAPLVTVVYPPSPTEEEFRAIFQMYDDLCCAGDKLGFVVDFRHFDPVEAPSESKRIAADVFFEHAEALRPVIVCEARVVTNAISRGTLTAFDWSTGTKWPCANFGTLAEADAWVRKRLEASGARPLVPSLEASGAPSSSGSPSTTRNVASR